MNPYAPQNSPSVARVNRPSEGLYLRQLQELRLTGDTVSRRAAVEASPLAQAGITALPSTPDANAVDVRIGQTVTGL
jgi:hypothetical protein